MSCVQPFFGPLCCSSEYKSTNRIVGATPEPSIVNYWTGNVMVIHLYKSNTITNSSITATYYSASIAIPDIMNTSANPNQYSKVSFSGIIPNLIKSTYVSSTKETTFSFYKGTTPDKDPIKNIQIPFPYADGNRITEVSISTTNDLKFKIKSTQSSIITKQITLNFSNLYFKINNYINYPSSLPNPKDAVQMTQLYTDQRNAVPSAFLNNLNNQYVDLFVDKISYL